MPSPAPGCDLAPLACLSVPYSFLPASPLLDPFLSPCASLFLSLNCMKTQSTGQDPPKVNQPNIAPQGWVMGFIYCESSV